MNEEKAILEDAEAWEGAHPSELALSCMADAQDVVPVLVRAHVESCAECTLRLGAMALESHEVSAAMRVASELRAHAPTPAHRFPTMLVAAAAVVAFVCAGPALVDAIPRAIAWAFAAPRIVPVLTTSAVALGESLSAGSSGAAMSLVTTFTLALVGYAVARASRQRSGVTR